MSPSANNNIPTKQGLQHDNALTNEEREKELLLPPVSEIMDTRIPYNMEYVMCNLLRVMVSKGMLSVNDAKRIMASGESYLH